MNWADRADYVFTESLDQKCWAWEFLRRNPDYRKEFANTKTLNSPIFVPPKHDDETEQEWGNRVIAAGGEPEKLARTVFGARRWRMKSPMQDPKSNDCPRFLEPYPKKLEWDDVGKYFEEPGPHAPIMQRPDKATVVFDLQRRLPAQIRDAKLQLSSMKKKIPKKSKTNIQKFEWQRYLRILDAKAAGVENNIIIQKIEPFAILDNTVASGYAANDRLSDNLGRARELLNDPLQILS